MMKRYISIAFAAIATVPLLAQETYENAKLVENDLNGTARYVGMGGAMEALGADISTISTNPAGIAMVRKSNISASMGVVSQQDATNFGGGHKTNVSFDQIGFVWANRTSETGYLNFAFNYHKSKNFNYILSAADQLNNASQNKLTYTKQSLGFLFPTYANGAPDVYSPYAQCNQLDDLYARSINYDTGNNTWYYENATGYVLDRSHKGYIGEYDFNLSGTIGKQVYLGLTVGLHDVHYKHYGIYTESFAANSPISVYDDRKITGTGADIKLGVIFRPIESSPFRIGLSIATPTWYDLKTSNYTYMADAGGTSAPNYETYEFKVYTPWKFGASLGHTIGNYLALGASYEYADYSSTDTRVITGSHYDWWNDSYQDDSESDDVMNEHTSQTLRGVSTFKVGLEYKPAPELAVRFGYNHVTPMYEELGFKNGALASAGSYYSSATDFTNWRAINRITCGLGFQIDKFNIAAAYQYSAQNGKFQPFMSSEGVVPAEDNIVRDASVSNKRHQVLVTATYTF